MRDRDEILKQFKDYTGVRLMAVPKEPERAKINNPKLILEVLLDIRDLLVELNKKK